MQERCGLSDDSARGFEGREVLGILRRFLKGDRKSNGFVFRSKRGSPLHETNVLHEFLHQVLKALGLPRAGMHAFRHGCNRRWELAGMNPAVLCQQMEHSSAVMTARYTGEIPLEQVRAAFSSMELENMGNGRSCGSPKLWPTLKSMRLPPLFCYNS